MILYHIFYLGNYINGNYIMTLRIPMIAIDGPSASGKGTVCRELSKILNWNILDSGAIYRILTLLAVQNNLTIESEELSVKSERLLLQIANTIKVSFIYKHNGINILLDGKDITKKIYSPDISNKTSRLSSLPSIRNALLQKQRSFLHFPGLVADGRDMGTIVFPDAPVKIFLYANIEERTYRRMLQLHNNGFNVNFSSLLEELKERDNRDRNRSISPLLPAKDALLIDSTNISINQVIYKVLKYTRQKLGDQIK